MDSRIKTRITQNTSFKGNGTSQLSLSYTTKKLDNSQASYEIISSLKADDNIIIEVTSALLNLNENETKVLESQLIDSFEEIGLDYRKKKISVNAKRTLFSIVMEGKKRAGFELLAYIPNDIWCSDEFKKIIPNIGVRYYLPKADTEINLDSFTNLEEEERSELCRMVIFDHIILGSMGINTSIYNKNDITEILSK